MDSNQRPLERAFDLAKSGRYHTVGDLKAQLHREGFALAAFVGPTLARQLRQLITESRKPTEAD